MDAQEQADPTERRQALREQLAALQTQSLEAWEAYRTDLTDLAGAAQSHDEPLVRARTQQVELSRALHAGIAESCKELRQQIDTITAEELARDSRDAAQAVARATWVLAGATIVLALATLALIWATLTA